MFQHEHDVLVLHGVWRLADCISIRETLANEKQRRTYAVTLVRKPGVYSIRLLLFIDIRVNFVNFDV